MLRLYEIMSQLRSKQEADTQGSTAIVETDNEFMGGVDKLDMMCALYKKTLSNNSICILIAMYII